MLIANILVDIPLAFFPPISAVYSDCLQTNTEPLVKLSTSLDAQRKAVMTELRAVGPTDKTLTYSLSFNTCKILLDKPTGSVGRLAGSGSLESPPLALNVLASLKPIFLTSASLTSEKSSIIFPLIIPILQLTSYLLDHQPHH